MSGEQRAAASEGISLLRRPGPARSLGDLGASIGHERRIGKTLQLSRQLKDQAVEAQSCYSLGNTYTLLQDYERAIEYHLKHLTIAQELEDRFPSSIAELGLRWERVDHQQELLKWWEREASRSWKG
ncbi:UNVERIFIED_CONTAM: hypothetical protein K2H54_049192 [Gekko kuhli]